MNLKRVRINKNLHKIAKDFAKKNNTTITEIVNTGVTRILERKKMIKAMPGYAVIKLPDAKNEGKSKSGIITGQLEQEVNNQGIIEDFDVTAEQSDLKARLDYCVKNKFTVVVRPFSGQMMAYDNARYLVVSVLEIQAIKE